MFLKLSLKAHCKYAKHGCKEVNKLEFLKRHEYICELRICEECGLSKKVVNKICENNFKGDQFT